MDQQVRQFKLNLPVDVKRWVAHCAAANMRSQSAEIIFLLRERMRAAAGGEFGDTTPAAAGNTAALQGSGNVNHG